MFVCVFLDLEMRVQSLNAEAVQLGKDEFDEVLL